MSDAGLQSLYDGAITGPRDVEDSGGVHREPCCHPGQLRLAAARLPHRAVREAEVGAGGSLHKCPAAPMPFPLLPLLDRGGTKSTPAMLQRNCFATTITTTTTFKNNNKRNPKLLFLPTTFALFPCEQQDRGTSASTSCRDLETKQHMNVKSLRIYGSQESWRDVNL